VVWPAPEKLDMEERLDSKPAQGRPRRMWINKILQWTKVDNYAASNELQKTDVNGQPVWEHVNLLIKKTTADDDDDDNDDAQYIDGLRVVTFGYLIWLLFTFMDARC